jgi:deoxyribose-phosphate aldolase
MNLAPYIDHTVLKPEAGPRDIEKLCREAVDNKFAAVCINPVYVSKARRLVGDSGVGVATVVGFPLGANTTETKIFETKRAIDEGATEIDMVMAVGLFKAGELKAVSRDIEDVVKASGKVPVKVILETCLLDADGIAKASVLAADAGAAFVKTSTGFASGGATVEAVRIMKEAVGNRCKIKASGGIRTRDQVVAMIEAGALRIGTSSGVSIVAG